MNSTLRFAVTLTTSAVSAFTGVFGGLRDAQSLQPLTVSAAPQSTSVYAWQHPKPALSDPVWAVGVLRDMGRTVFTEPLPADMAVDAPVAGFPSPLRLISNPQTNKGLEVTKWYIDRTNPDNPRALSLVYDHHTRQVYMLRAERYPSTERGQQGHEQLVTFTSVETYRISGAALAKLASDFPHSCQLGSLKEVNCDPHSLDSHLPLVSMVYDENTRSHTKNYDDATIRALAETLCGDEIADLKAHGYSLDSQSLAWMVNEADYDRASLRGMASALSVKRDANGDVEHYGVEWPFYPGEYRPHIVYLDAKGQWFSQSWPDGLTSLLREMNPETGMFSAIQVRLPRENEAEEVRANKEGEIPADLASFATNPFHGLFLPEKVVRIMAPAVARPDDPAPR